MYLLINIAPFPSPSSPYHLPFYSLLLWECTSWTRHWPYRTEQRDLEPFQVLFQRTAGEEEVFIRVGARWSEPPPIQRLEGLDNPGTGKLLSTIRALLEGDLVIGMLKSTAQSYICWQGSAILQEKTFRFPLPLPPSQVPVLEDQKL